MYPTNYVMNATNSPDQNTSDLQWVGELLFSYRVGSGNWIEASTNRSADVRRKSQNGNQITVTYNNSANSDGIRNFELTERYSLVEDYVLWEITLKNTGNQDIVFADIGLPLPFNEKWLQSNDVIYETRTLAHSHVAQNSSYMRITRPSGRGKFLLMIPDASTGAGFEYRVSGRELITREVPGQSIQPAVPTGETAISIPKACMFTISIPTGSNLWEGDICQIPL